VVSMFTECVEYVRGDGYVCVVGVCGKYAWGVCVIGMKSVIRCMIGNFYVSKYEW
jgi:hypothetical protein